MADLKHIYIYFNIKFEFKQKRLRQFKLTFDLGWSDNCLHFDNAWSTNGASSL